jgi:transcriptional regulator of acetoin/glycerol metabolism
MAALKGAGRSLLGRANVLARLEQWEAPDHSRAALHRAWAAWAGCELTPAVDSAPRACSVDTVTQIATAPTHSGIPDLQGVVDRFGEAAGESAHIRDEIASSWQRSALAGLRPERFVVPYRADIDDAGRLAWAAAPIIAQLVSDLEGTRAAIILTDERAHILARIEADRPVARRLDDIDLAPGFVYLEDSVGTNAIGTAIARRRPSLVHGQEHFAHALTSMACAAVTVTDPGSGQIMGVVDLTSAAQDASPFMMPLAKRITWEIEQRLLHDFSLDERALRERFLKAQRLARGPLVAVNERTLLVNDAARAIVQPADHEVIWAMLGRMLVRSEQGQPRAILSGGQEVSMRCEPVFEGARLVGALVHLSPRIRPTHVAAEQHIGRGAPRFGWSSLTRTERIVADHVANGLTNIEIANRLVLSPHTIDYHLRQVFRKLEVRSRVELTRAMLEARLVGVAPEGT